MTRSFVITEIKKKYPLAIILLLAFATRSYRLLSTYLFQGDQGRDALVMYRLLTGQELVLLGPTTSVGHYYLGPFFYYLSAPFLWLTNFNPIGPVALQVILGTCTVAVIYSLVTTITNRKIGLLMASMVSLAPTMISYSRFAWNPNPSPFVASLLLLCLLLAIRTKQPKWMIGCGLVLSILWQLHYVLLLYGIVLIPITYLWYRQRFQLKTQLLGFSSLGIAMALALGPLAASVYKSFGVETESQLLHLGFNVIPKLLSIPVVLIANLFQTNWTNPVVLLWTGLFLIGVVAAIKTRQLFWQTIVVATGITILGLALLKTDLEIHYLLGFYPLVFILWASGLQYLSKNLSSSWNLTLFALLAVSIVWQYVYVAPDIYQAKGLTAIEIKSITQKITEHAQGSPFNFALIADLNERQAYQYYFRLLDAPEQIPVTDQIYIVCEQSCQIRSNPDWQIAQFEATHLEKVTYEKIDILDFNEEYPMVTKGKIMP